MAGMIAIAPSAVMAADMENGAQVFAGNCAACHAGGNNVIQNEKVNNAWNTRLSSELHMPKCDSLWNRDGDNYLRIEVTESQLADNNGETETVWSHTIILPYTP